MVVHNKSEPSWGFDGHGNWGFGGNHSIGYNDYGDIY